MEVDDPIAAGPELIIQFSMKFLKRRLAVKSKDIKDSLAMSIQDVRWVLI